GHAVRNRTRSLDMEVGPPGQARNDLLTAGRTLWSRKLEAGPDAPPAGDREDAMELPAAPAPLPDEPSGKQPPPALSQLPPRQRPPSFQPNTVLPPSSAPGSGRRPGNCVRA